LLQLFIPKEADRRVKRGLGNQIPLFVAPASTQQAGQTGKMIGQAVTPMAGERPKSFWGFGTCPFYPDYPRRGDVMDSSWHRGNGEAFDSE
jgi:hypothetical protein